MTRLENLRRHLRAARLALVSDELYREAIAQIGDEDYERESDAISRINRWAIDAANDELPKPRKRRRTQ